MGLEAFSFSTSSKRTEGVPDLCPEGPAAGADVDASAAGWAAWHSFGATGR